MNLRDALHEFRRDATVKKFSRAVLKNSGPGVVMSNEILQRVVDCAHFHKIESREQLERETRWAGAGEFGDEIVDLISKHRPKPPPTADELNEGDSSSSSRVVKSRKCSKCGALDHICKVLPPFYPFVINTPSVASNRKCPRHPQNQIPSLLSSAAFQDENIAPLPGSDVPLSPEPNPTPRPLPRPLFRLRHSAADVSGYTPVPSTSIYTPSAPQSTVSFSAPVSTPLPCIDWLGQSIHTPVREPHPLPPTPHGDLSHLSIHTPAPVPHFPPGISLGQESPFPLITTALPPPHFYGYH